MGCVFVWGYGKACGSWKGDILTARRLKTERNCFIYIAGGRAHSLALTGKSVILNDQFTVKFESG